MITAKNKDEGKVQYNYKLKEVFTKNVNTKKGIVTIQRGRGNAK